MEKLFWGMIGACTAAFGILLCMYLNKIGVIGGTEPETATEIVSNLETDVEMETAFLSPEELAAEIQSRVENSQSKYADAMLVFEEESAAVASREEAKENNRPAVSTTI